MIFYPAIDLKQGQCVRLLRGVMTDATVYHDNPADQAKMFAADGCQWLHVVDLDGAFAGKPQNIAAVRAILEAVEIPVQLGGGIRSMAQIEQWLEAGVQRVILGTAALTDPALVIEACKVYPEQIAVGIDARNGFVATEGWDSVSTMTAVDLARRLEGVGVAALIFTDIDRDGTKAGVNVEATAALAEAVTIPVIASGGVGTLADLSALKAVAARGVAGVICGRALYDKAFSVREALDVLAC